ncbi:MAG: glutamate 5-kinase [Acholeplasmatales bacterium]|nr:glutamate 5-kinase [Acholeplasmatales bacterium]
MRDFKNIKRIVIKVGSSSLVKKDLSINIKMLNSIMSGFSKLKDLGIDSCLVTSGAIAVGMHELGLTKKPTNMALKQACAAVGQAKLMESYNSVANLYELKLGQILVNHDDFQVRKRMVLLSDTLDSMFKNNIIPVINENDALAVDEIKVGDNDTLASLISPMVSADLLILFSDINGLYDKNPKLYDDAKMISDVKHIDESIISMATGATSKVGTGGMETKIKAALISNMSGLDMIICNSNKIDELVNIVKGEEIGTLFNKYEKCISSRDDWMIFKTNSCGQIILDKNFKNDLNVKKVSILPTGITDCKGEFLKGSIIDIKNSDGVIIAKGISNYSSNEINLIKGHKSSEFTDILGYKGKSEVIHADNLVVIKEEFYGFFIK